MSKKIRKITSQGQRVLGALATYIAPRLAADSALKAGELTPIIKSVKPADFDKQINGIIGTVVGTFKSRLAKDAELDPDEIKELLESLDPDADMEDYEEEDEMPDLNESESVEDADDPLAKLAACIAKCKGLAPEEVDELNGIINEMTHKGAEDEFPPEKEDEGGMEGAEAKDKKAKDKAAKDRAAKDRAAKDKFPPGAQAPPFGKKKEDKEEVPQAMDAKLIERNVTANIAARFQAAKDVEQYVGVVDPMAFDSAEKIYGYALKSNDIDTKGVHPSAFKAMLPLLGKSESPRTIAMDAKAQDELTKKYTYIPAQA